MNTTEDSPGYARLLALHPDYCRREKMIRMCSGCSSSPVSYENDVVEIEIRLSDSALGHETKGENIIDGLIKHWMKAVPNAKLYRAHIYKSGAAKAGFMTSSPKLKGRDEKPGEEAIKSLAKTIHQMMTAERIDVKIDEREWPSEADASQSD